MQENNQKDKDITASEPAKTPEPEVVPAVNGATVVSSPVLPVTEGATEEPKTETEPKTVASETVAPVVATEAPAGATVAATATTISPVVKKYAVTALVVLVIGFLLVFGLERQGRIDTNFFGFMSSASPAAVVNDEEISQIDFNNSLAQLLNMAAAQGQDTTDPAVISQYETQAIDTLVSGELLRQAALEAGMEATTEAIEARFAEIEAGVGGAETLKARMVEFGITESTLRRDIENEILIQGLFDSVFGTEPEVVTEEEIVAFYEGLGNVEGLPPLEEVREQVAEQIRLERQQTEIGAYIETLRSAATVEILI